MICIGENSRVLLYNGQTKLAQDLNLNDILLISDGSFAKPLNISNARTALIKINTTNGKSISCGLNMRFSMINKEHCRRPLEDLKDAKKIISTPTDYSYLINQNISNVGTFTPSMDRAWILGLAASNGRFIVDKNKKITGFTIFSKEDVLDKLKDNFSCASIRKNKNLYSLTGKEIIEFFLYHLSGNGKQRKLSTDIVWMDCNLQLEFIKGWLFNKYTSNNFIGVAQPEILDSIAFILCRLGIPYSINDKNNKIVIAKSNLKKLGFIQIDNRKEYRNFFNDILFQIKNIENIGFQKSINFYANGVIVNGYSLYSDFNNANVVFDASCKKCNEKINLQDGVCSDCQQKELENISWRYKSSCKRCGKLIKNLIGTKKFCSNICRRKFYNPLDVKNNAKTFKGYFNKGFLSYPQKFIYDVLTDHLNEKITYNDRTIIKNPKTNYPLELDIWCEERKLAIEFDGKLHFENNNDTKLKYSKLLDEIKNEECSKNGIKLIRISYKDDWKNKDWIINKIWSN